MLSRRLRKRTNQQGDRSVNGALLREHDGAGGMAKLISMMWLLQQVLHCRHEGIDGVQLDGGGGGQQLSHDVSKVGCTGAKHDGGSESGWFQHVLSTS